MQPQDILVTTATPNYACATGSGKLLQTAYSFSLGATNNGNVAGITNCLDGSRTQSFSYDEFNRIKTAGVPTAWGLSFDYDPWGNLLAQNVTQGSAPSMSVSVNVKNQMIGYGFDAAGNRTSNGGSTYTYDAENRLKTAGGVTYTYDGDGRRVKKSNGKLYWYSIAGEILTETDLAGAMTAEYVFFGGKRVARRLPDNTVHYYYSDHLGSTSLITNNVGLVKVDSDYYPFGGERIVLNTLNNRYKFTGKERDTESDLDYFGARYYGSTLGRFLSADPVYFQAAMIADPQMFNLYAYARNNPLIFVDPTGESIELLGDEVERAKQLAALRQAVGAEAGAYLYENAVTTTDENGNTTTRYFVGVYTNGPDGKGPAFDQINSVAGELAPIIEDTKNVQLQVVGEVGVKDDFGNKANINARTPAATGIFKGNLRIVLLDPSIPYLPLDSFMMSNNKLGGNTPGSVLGHELGHARAVMSGVLMGDTSPDSLRLENKVRTLKDPGAPQRMIHDCPPGACGSVPK